MGLVEFLAVPFNFYREDVHILIDGQKFTAKSEETVKNKVLRFANSKGEKY